MVARKRGRMVYSRTIMSLMAAGTALIGMTVPALAEITTTTTTIYSYNFLGQSDPVSQKSTTEITGGGCGLVYPGGGEGGSSEGSTGGGFVDLNNDGIGETPANKA